MKTYTVERINENNFREPQFVSYLRAEIPQLAARFGNDVNFKNADVRELVTECMFYVCYRDGIITGHMILDLYSHCFDPEVKVLNQISLYAKPDSGRTAWHLFQKMLDIGKSQANYIITMVTPQTNIKSSTLENMGFKYLETSYRLEVK